MTDRSASASPHYITLDDCQIRVWRRGEGPDLVVLPGLALGASVVAARLGDALAGWTVSVLELPGLGGSISAAAETLDATAERLAAACRLLRSRDLRPCGFRPRRSFGRPSRAQARPPANRRHPYWPRSRLRLENAALPAARPHCTPRRHAFDSVVGPYPRLPCPRSGRSRVAGLRRRGVADGG